MPALTFYTENALWGGTFYSSSQTQPAVVFLANSSGWVVGTTAAPKYAAAVYGIEATGLGTGPTSSLISSSAAGNAIALGPFTGSFAAGNWQITQSVKGNTRTTSTTGGKLHYLVFKGADASGSGATLISSTYGTSSAFANLAKATAQMLTSSYSLPAINCQTEYLFFAFQLGLTTAGDNANADVNLQLGGTTGSLFITPVYTSASVPPVTATYPNRVSFIWLHAENN